MTDIITEVINEEKKAIRALDKAQGGIIENLRKLVEHEAFSAAMVGSYLTNFEEAMISIGYEKNNATYKVMKSQRKKVLSFCAGALDQQGDWTDTQVDLEAERIMLEPSLQKAYAAVSESLKDAKAEPEGEGDSEGDSEGEGEGGEECTDPTGAALSEAKHALVRLAFDLIAAMPDDKTDDAHEALKELFARYEA